MILNFKKNRLEIYYFIKICNNIRYKYYFIFKLFNNNIITNVY